MKTDTTTYRILKKAVAAFLVLGILLPSALQAKQLVDFCMMEMSHPEMMDDSHECCASDQTQHATTQKRYSNCESTQICVCTVDTLQAKNQFRVPTVTSSLVILSPAEFNFTVTSPDEFIYKEYFAAAVETSPPLYLLYDTFLN